MRTLCAIFSCVFFLGAAAFDATDDNIRVGAISIPTNITVSMWTYCDSYAQTAYFILREPTEWRFYTVGAVTYLIGGTSAVYVTMGTSNFTDGQWNHVCFSIEGTAGIIYVNGVSKASGTVVAIGNSGEINIGNRDVGNTHVWDGRIADVQIWDDVRTPEEINAYMYRRPAGNEPNLVLYLPLDEQTGTNAVDRQTNITRNDGTLELFAAGSEWGDNPPTTHGE